MQLNLKFILYSTSQGTGTIVKRRSTCRGSETWVGVYPISTQPEGLESLSRKQFLDILYVFYLILRSCFSALRKLTIR